MRRPLTLTLAALVLGWTGAGGFLLGYAAAQVPAWGAGRYLVALVGVGFGLTAWASAVGLWQRRAWTPYALEGWRIAFFLAAITPTLLFRAAAPATPWWQGPLTAVAAFLLATFLVNFLRRQWAAAA